MLFKFGFVNIAFRCFIPLNQIIKLFKTLLAIYAKPSNATVSIYGKVANVADFEYIFHRMSLKEKKI